MGIYSINPKTQINSANILNIMLQLLLEISNSIQSIFNIIVETQYILIINVINQILNNYLKIYNFYNYGVSNLYVQIYNQNIELVVFIVIQLKKYRYINLNSNWNDFIKQLLNTQTKIIYMELEPQEKNDLRYSIVSCNLYFIGEKNFIYNQLNTIGMLLKPKNNNCKCNNQLNCSIQYTYVSTIYWN